MGKLRSIFRDTVCANDRKAALRVFCRAAWGQILTLNPDRKPGVNTSSAKGKTYRLVLLAAFLAYLTVYLN